MSLTSDIQAKLMAALSPERIELIDESAAHAGHAGAREGGNSHFRLTIVSIRFQGLNRVARQRLVNEALAAELAGPVHALAMTCLTPAEATGR